MSASALTALIARCRVLCRPRSPAADAELLRRFAQQRDAAAFEELLERHAVLVWGVCRRILPNEADCEDAFQATFLALVNQAGAVDARSSLGAWLHTVAVRVARKTLARSQRQRPQTFLPEPATPGDIADEVGNRELFRLVDEEVERLPVLLRQPLILCCLQGRTRDEAAEALDCSVAAVKSRLERGRDLLRQRLQRRGIELPAAFLALGLTTDRIRAALWAKTMQSALYAPAPGVVALSEAGVSAATISKCKWILAALLLVSSAAGAVGTLLTEKSAETPTIPQTKAGTAEPKKPEAPRERTDRHGDPLPDGAIARLGTVRWRHGFGVFALAYSPNGKMIAAVGAGRSLTLWDAATGKEVQQFPNIGQTLAVAFSPDGKMLATTRSNICYLWDVATGKELRRLKGHQNGVGSVAFAPDGKLAATASADGTVRLWDPATGKELRRVDFGQGKECALAYSPDGKWIATTTRDGIIHLLDPATGKEQRQFSGHKKAIWRIVFSLDSKRLATSSADGTIRLWDVATSRQLRILAADLGEERMIARPIAFSPDGALLALGHQDGTIRLWYVEDGAKKGLWQTDAPIVGGIAFSPDGKTLAAGSFSGSIGLWDVATGRERHPSQEHLDSIRFLRFSADGASLVSISNDRRVLCWDLATRTPRRRFAWTGQDRIAVALSPDGNTLAVGSLDDKSRLREGRLWDVRTGQPGRMLANNPGMLWPVAFSPDGRLIASGDNDKIIHIWDTSNGKEVRQIPGVRSKVRSLCFSPDSKTLACGIAIAGNVLERRVYLWDVASGKERPLFEIGRVRDASYEVPLAFSPDGRMLASGAGGLGRKNMVRLWNTATGKELCRHMDIGLGNTFSVIVFSPDSKLVASGIWEDGPNNSSVHVWEAATGRLIRRFEGHHSGVGSLEFSPDGLSVASGAGDSTILLWDITGRRPGGCWHAKPLTPRQLDDCWTALANEDADKAYDAVWALADAPEQAVPFLQKHLPPVPHPDVKLVARLIADLDSDDFQLREKATKELGKMGNAIAPALRRTLEGKPSAEAQRRIQQLLDQNRGWTAERLREHRAIQALEHMGTQKAKEALQSLAAGAPGAFRTEEAKDALRRISKPRPEGSGANAPRLPVP